MKTFKFFSLLFVLLLASCARHDNTVIIHSAPADSIFTEINFVAPGTEQKIIFEIGKTFRHKIDSVETRYFYSNSSDGHFWTSIFITPGDSVSFKTIAKDDNFYEVIFEGKNAAHYNYASQKKKSISLREPDFFSNSNIDLLEYKQQLQDYRDKENEFLRKYKKENTVSNDFMNYASAEISNLYALKLYQSAYFNKCRILPKNYLDGAVITQNPLSEFAFEALKFKYIYCSPDTNMEKIYNAILNEVHSKFHSVLLSELISWFAEKGDKAYKKSLLQIMDKIEKTSTDSTLLATVQEYKSYYLLSGTMLPDSILNNTYLRSFQSNQKITLRQLLDNYKNTAVFLDFWASWCSPCRQTNRESVDNKSYFAEKNMAVVYISIDENENAWLQAAKEDHIMENQYLLLNGFRNSPIDPYLKIGKGGIPRYILFNRNHEMEVLSAPRPIDCMFEELKEMIERNPEKFRQNDNDKISQEQMLQKEIKTKVSYRTEIQHKTQTATNMKQTQEDGVLINGVVWATRNVAAPGTFAINLEDAGMFYQWNRKKGWPAKGKITGWDNSMSTGISWEKANDPSPIGWRVPTGTEIKSLHERDKVKEEWTIINDVKGTRFTDKSNGNSIFLPASGFRYGNTGELYRLGSHSFFWGREQWGRIDKGSIYMFFHCTRCSALSLTMSNRNYGFSVRPVAE